MKEVLLQKLEKYNYQFLLVENDIVVKLGLSQKVRIDITQTNKIILTDEFTGWNFITGFLSMSLKNAMIYNTIGIFFAVVLVSFLDSKIETTILLILSVFAIGLIVMWTSYYLIKLESFKRQIIFWTDDK